MQSSRIKSQFFLIHGCKHEKCKHIEDEEENLIENVTTSQNVWMIIFFMCTKSLVYSMTVIILLSCKGNKKEKDGKF